MRNSARTAEASPAEGDLHPDGGIEATAETSATRRIFGGTVIRSVGELVAKAASVAFYIAIARELGSGPFGDFIFALALSALLFTAAGFGTDDLVAREVAKDRSSLAWLFPNVLLLKTLIIFAMLGVIAAVITVQGYPPETKLAMVLVSVGSGLEVISKTLQSVFQAYERMQYIAATLIIQRALVALVGIVVLLHGGSLLQVCVVFAVGGVVANLSAWFWLRRAIGIPPLRVDTTRWAPILRAGAPLGFAAAIYYALIKVDATLLSFLNGGNNTEVGHYGAAFRLIEATMFVSWAFGGAMFPWLSRRDDSSTGLSLARGYELGLKALMAMLLPIGAFFAIYAKPLIDLLYGASFHDAILPLRFLAAMTVLYGINAFIATLMIARGRPSEFTKPALFVVGQNVVFNLILIPPLGATGAAINAVISGVLLAGLTVHAAERSFGEIHLGTVLAAPALGCLGIALVAVIFGVALTPASVVLSVVAYLGVLLVAERLLFTNDWAFYATALRLRKFRGAVPPAHRVASVARRHRGRGKPPDPDRSPVVLRQVTARLVVNPAPMGP